MARHHAARRGPLASGHWRRAARATSVRRVSQDTAPRFVIVMGVAGAGKTTVGQALAARLGWPFHDADDFHAPESIARMRAGQSLDDAARAPWLARLRALAADVLAGESAAVLACSALKHAYRDALVPAGTPPGAVRFVHLRVSPPVLAERLATRPGHFAPPALLGSQLATLEPPDATEPALAVDGERPVDELVETIVRRLGLG